METNLIPNYKVFEGIYNKQMPLLVKENYQPSTTKDIMLNRIKAINSNNKQELDFWLNQYFDTVDGLAYHNNQLIVTPNSELLLNINENSKLNNGSLILNKDQFKELSKNYEILNRSNIIDNKQLTKQQAKEHPIWLKLVQGDKSLLNEYTDLIFAKAKEIYNYNENMGIYLPSDQENPALRAWYLRYLDYYRSDANAGNDLNGSARLFGVQPKNLEQLLGKIVLDQGLNQEELQKAIKFYKLNKELIK